MSHDAHQSSAFWILVDGVACGMLLMIAATGLAVLLGGLTSMGWWTLLIGCLGVAGTAGTVAGRAGCGKGFRPGVAVMASFLALPILRGLEWIAFLGMFQAVASGGRAISPEQIYLVLTILYAWVGLPLAGVFGFLFHRR